MGLATDVDIGRVEPPEAQNPAWVCRVVLEVAMPPCSGIYALATLDADSTVIV